MGTRGAVLLERPSSAGAAAAGGAERTLESVLSELTAQAQAASSTSSSQPVCVSPSGVTIGPSTSAETPGTVRLGYSAGRDPAQARKQQEAAAERAAALNAQAGKGSAYAASSTSASASTSVASRPAALEACVTYSTIAGLPKGAVVDTTGAGDSFIGSVLYGVSTAMPRSRMMQLACTVAACKCTALGARPGLPRRANLSEPLLS